MAILKRVSALAVSVLIIGCILWGVPASTLIGAEEERSTTDANDAGSDGGFMLPLVRPVFAQTEPMAALTTFIEREAGISAFTNVGRKIDLTRARGAFRTIERETANYTLGSVGITGKTEWWDVHVLVHRDGWILAYYHRIYHTGKMINWADLGTTNMAIALGQVAAAAGVPVTTISHYDFRFPTAQNMMLIRDDDSFRIRIPSEFIVFDRSFRGYIAINGVSISRGYGSIGTISVTKLMPDIYHRISGNSVLILTYSEN